MTIHLPPELETPIQAAVHSGRYASLDDAMTQAASLLVQHMIEEDVHAAASPASRAEATPNYKPIWEVAAEIRKSIPAEEWAKLPKDGAEQLDHYIYGSPKRPSS